jgi:hypothetical protein
VPDTASVPEVVGAGDPSVVEVVAAVVEEVDGEVFAAVEAGMPCATRELADVSWLQPVSMGPRRPTAASTPRRNRRFKRSASAPFPVPSGPE